MTILARLDAALDTLALRWPKRGPKAVYLNPTDWAEFEALGRTETVTAMWGNNPQIERTDPVYRDVPIRESNGETSRLYDVATRGHLIPLDPNASPPAPRDGISDIPPAEVADALDRISRTRALTEDESLSLEWALKGRSRITKREAARLGIKRKS